MITRTYFSDLNSASLCQNCNTHTVQRITVKAHSILANKNTLSLWSVRYFETKVAKQRKLMMQNLKGLPNIIIQYMPTFARLNVSVFELEHVDHCILKTVPHSYLYMYFCLREIKSLK